MSVCGVREYGCPSVGVAGNKRALHAAMRLFVCAVAAFQARGFVVAPLSSRSGIIPSEVRLEAKRAQGFASQYSRRSLVEFLPTGGIYPVVGMLTEPRGKYWQVKTAQGSLELVGIERMTFVDSLVPGWTGLGPSDLSGLPSAILEILTPTLTESMWADLQDQSVVTLPDVARRLQNGHQHLSSTSARFIAHKLLTGQLGQVYFSPSDVHPHCSFRRRNPNEVEGELRLHALKQKREAEWKLIGAAFGSRATKMMRATCSFKVSESRNIRYWPELDGMATSSLENAELALRELEALALDFGRPSLESSIMKSKEEQRNGLVEGFIKSQLGKGPLAAWPASDEGAFQLLVHLGWWSIHHDLGLARSGLPHSRDWPEDALQESRYLIENPPVDPFLDIRQAPFGGEVSRVGGQEVIGTREDFTSMITYAIDNHATLEVDDAMSAERFISDDGISHKVRLWIHVSDASRWLDSDELILAAQAFERQTSLYLPTGKLTMLPLDLVTRAAALAPPRNDDPTLRDEERGISNLPFPSKRFALSLGCELDERGALIDSSVKLCCSTIRPSVRLTYEEADEMFSFGLCGPAEPDWALGALQKAALLRRKYRAKSGLVVDNLPYVDVIVRPDLELRDHGSESISVSPSYQGSDSYTTVMEMMLLAGEAVGTLGRLHRIPLPYRCQKPPRDGLPANLDGLLHDLDISSGSEPFCRTAFLRKFMTKTNVSPSPGQHFSLGLRHYVQWSSPLRRHSDLLVHWQLKSWLLATQAETLRRERRHDPGEDWFYCPFPTFTKVSLHELLQNRERVSRRAAQVQREGTRYWLLEYLRRGGNRRHKALVLGPAPPNYETDRRVLLTDLGAEMQLECDGGPAFAPGRHITVAVDSCNPRSGAITLRVVPDRHLT